MNKRVTMNTIAQELGISKNSVSLALNNKNGVGDDLRKRIIDKAAELGYGSYSAQRDSISRCVIVIVPEYLHNDVFFYSDVLWAIETEARNQNCMSISISVTREMEAAMELPMLPKEMNILGLLTVGVLSNTYIAELYKLRLPMLTVDISYNNIPIGCVGTANLQGGYIATDYLIGSGHKEIGFIGPIHTAQSVFERWCGFCQAMTEHGLKVNEAYNITGKGHSFELFDTVHSLEPYWGELKAYPTAWVCAGDRIAIALMHLLARYGYKVPDDISIVGFDDIKAAIMVLPRLTTVRIDRRLMGELAVDRLINLPEHQTGAFNTNIVGTLIVRDSVRALL